MAPNVIANFTLPPAACAPFNAIFRNTSTAGQQFFWDFGDGATSTQTNPSHVYARPGTYPVQLIAVDANTCNKRDTIVKNLVVVNKPTASFTYSPNPTMPNTPVQLVNTSVGAVTYKWIFGDGNSLVTSKRDTIIAYQYQKTATYNAVPYTHLTLPTKREVKITRVAVKVKTTKKEKKTADVSTQLQESKKIIGKKSKARGLRVDVLP